MIGAIPLRKDYVAGLVSGIVYEERLPDGNWKKYRSRGEKQFGVYMDSMGCVSFSFANGVEENIDWLKKTNQLSIETVKKLLPKEEDQMKFLEFFNDDGKVDLSDRALAKLSNTTEEGNMLSLVARTGRSKAVPERKWPFPSEQRDPVFDWDDFYKEIPEELVKEYSRVFFTVFKIETEFINPTWENIKYHLKQAPIQIASGICPGWDTDRPIKTCDRHNDHATLIDGQKEMSYELFDHYPPFDKELEKGYKIDGALKIIVSVKKPINIIPMIVKENTLYQLVEHPGGFALGLNGKLIIDDIAKILASWLVRNNGKTESKVATCLLKDWNSVPHINLKGEKVN